MPASVLWFNNTGKSVYTFEVLAIMSVQCFGCEDLYKFVRSLNDREEINYIGAISVLMFLLFVINHPQLHRTQDPKAAARIPTHRLGVHRSESD